MEVPGQLLNWMRKHDINPHPRSEAERRAIQAQLSMRPAGMQAGMIPKYFIDKKERFMQQVANLGFDLFQVQDFLDNRGICEMQVNNVLDNMPNPNYVNVLKLFFAPPQ